MMFGDKKESGVWIAPKSRWKLMFWGHDSLYIAVWRFRLRVMKPNHP